MKQFLIAFATIAVLIAASSLPAALSSTHMQSATDVDLTSTQASYIADSQTVTTAMNTPVTFHLTGSAPEDFFYRVLTHPDVADTCTEGYVPDPPSCDHGYMEYNGMTGQVWYVPNTDFVGTDSFTFETAAEMGPESGDVIGVVTIVVTATAQEEEEGGEEANNQSENNNNNNNDNPLRGFTPLTLTGMESQSNLAVNAVTLDGERILHMWTVIDTYSVDAFTGETTYNVYANNYQDILFDHWEDGSTDRTRTLTISEDTIVTAYYAIAPATETQ